MMSDDLEKHSDSFSPQAREMSKPPLSCIVINSTPDSTDQNGGGFFTSPSSARPAAQRASSDTYRSAPTAFNSSFKLMPRKKIAGICTPSPSSRKREETRGLKRNAVSISSPSTNSDISPGSLLSLNQAPTFTDGSLYKLQQLSLQSPITQKSTSSDDMKSPNLGSNPDFVRQRVSSFSAYSASSPNGLVNARASINASVSVSTTNSSLHISRTPCSSTISSPRHVPLTVISGQASSSNTSPTKTPTSGRPPVHSLMSSMLYSIDAQEDSPDSNRSRKCVLSDEMITPRATQLSKPTSGPSAPRVIGISPRTPLPRITLTPRTPLSTLSTRAGPRAMPTFASPSDDGISSTPYSRQNDEMGNMMDSLLSGFPNTKGSRADVSFNSTSLKAFSSQSRGPASSWNSLDFSQDGSNTLQAFSPLQQEDSFQSLKSELGFQEEQRKSKLFAPFTTIKTQPFDQNGTPLRRNRRNKRDDTSEDDIPITRSRSLLKDDSQDFLEDIIRVEARVGVVDAETGSLSDSDDENEFVLASPKQVSRPKYEANHRAKQRRKRSMERSSLHLSNKSLTSPSSNASLYGMDIMHKEGGDQSSTIPFLLTSKLQPGSGVNQNWKDIDCGSSSGFCRLKSEHSLGSLGLCLDGPSHFSDRDLVTPPITLQKASSPPPLFHNGIRDQTFAE
eukprot:CAMPEP_0202455192 /NCGR_PEP_ID=MMETSP1360-20130828/12785_1 /ASSEMBLY_ACC=CAM_ASM_000848 /TAXON_ID=515479 /ORGANISM="Licmophora paradoxa, Strain CCMP2313" /LENGTH=674 /DNA_ID=CAMNT_0049074721 /DNA_START=151 /DNA_END=2175 /DNA_ORIENTATION=-